MAHPNYIKMHIRTVPELRRLCGNNAISVKNTLEDEKLGRHSLVRQAAAAAACNGAEFI